MIKNETPWTKEQIKYVIETWPTKSGKEQVEYLKCTEVQYVNLVQKIRKFHPLPKRPYRTVMGNTKILINEVLKEMGLTN